MVEWGFPRKTLGFDDWNDLLPMEKARQLPEAGDTATRDGHEHEQRLRLPGSVEWSGASKGDR